MNKKIKQQWVEALRSGKYSQTTGKLRKAHSNGYCCLGVLCNIYAKEEGLRWSHDKYGDYADLKGEDSFLSESVMYWAGLKEGNPRVTVLQGTTTLSELNDKGTKFDVIADIIEKQL